MTEKCVGSRFIGRARLEDHRFVFDGSSDMLRRRSLANVVCSEGDTVWGGLYEIEEDDLKALDDSEFCPSSFGKKTAVVRCEDGKTYEAVVYCRDAREPGVPLREYRETLIQGTRDCGLPKDYTMKITYRTYG
ncbi:MAG: gamma-glutamylcyclotransferase [Candidatus Altiarchaeota archaeon]|nr:gamma-glutamylcyclotransferase [Candidatus Altiarchaeota archaeon]